MSNQILTTLLLSIFIALLGIGIIIPVMPVFAEELGANGFSLGMIIAAFSISRGVLQPVIGNLSDRWGRKGFLVTGLFIYGIVGLLIPLASNVSNLIVVRGIHGIGSAMIVPIGMAYVSYLSPPGQEGRYMGYLNIAIFCGIGCGPILGGLISDLLGFGSVFLVMAVLSFSASLLVIFLMPSKQGSGAATHQSLLKNVSLMVRDRKTMGILLARFSTMIIMVPTMAFLPLLMNERLSASGLQIGLVIACRTLVNAVLQVPAGRFADKQNKTVLLIVGCSCLSVAIIAIPSAETFTQMVMTYLFLGIGEAIIWPVLGAYASQEGKGRYGHGTMMGVYSLAMSAGVLCGALVAGQSMDSLGIDWAYYTTGITLFFLSMTGAAMIWSGSHRLHKDTRGNRFEIL